MYKITSVWPHQDQIKVEWNIGKRCNYDCGYCPSSIHDNYSQHTDLEILKKVIDKLTELKKPVRLSLTGGEPSVHPRIEALLEYAKIKNVTWINMTTNGTRKFDWYLDMEKFIDHYIFSLHFEYDWSKILDTIIHFSNYTEKNFFVTVMAHHEKMKEVRDAVQFLEETDISFAVRRIRWTEGDHNVFDDLKYNHQDLEWLLQKESTVQPNTLMFYKNNIEKTFHSNDIIKQHLNQFKGWNCNAGIESLMINWDGEVHRATCRVGGSLGNIYQETFVMPVIPIICTRDWCTCSADIPLTKEKIDDR